MTYNIILYFRLPYFHVSNRALFSTKYLNTLILNRRSLDTFYTQVDSFVPSRGCAQLKEAIHDH